MVERASQVGLILRNFSFLASNITVLGKEPSIAPFLVRCLAFDQMPPHKIYKELRAAALDVIDEIGSKLHIKVWIRFLFFLF